MIDLTNYLSQMHNTDMHEPTDNSRDQDSEVKQQDRKAILRQAKGMWRDRDDLPDFQALRLELNRNK